MIPLAIHHRTAYRYRRPVDLWPHRLMLCPRESCDLQVISCVVTVSPTAQVIWAHDVFGSAVATAAFQGASDSLVIESVVELRPEPTAWPIFNIAASAILYPFRYSDDEWTDLGSLTRQQYQDPAGRLATWARAFVCGDRTDNACAARGPQRRHVRGDRLSEQGRRGRPVANRDSRQRLGLLPGLRGLFVEAACCLGFGARLVSGYLFNPDQMLQGSTDAGSTHAWGEVFVSGAGWISFDPTNRSVGGANLIPVAVARDIRQCDAGLGRLCGKQRCSEEHVSRGPHDLEPTPSWRQTSGRLCVRRGAWSSGLLLGLSECGARARRQIWLTR